MKTILGIVVVGVMISLYEMPALLRMKSKKELGIFLLLLMTGMTLSILNSLRVEIPNPFDFLTKIYNPLTNLIFNIL